jgi:hypothetical protein
MAHSVSPYYDIDTGTHKRQRTTATDRHGFTANEASNAGLAPHATFGPVRDVTPDNTSLFVPNLSVFEPISPGNDYHWLPLQNTEIFIRPYTAGDLTDQFNDTSFADNLNEPQESSAQITIGSSNHEFTPSFEGEANPEPDAGIICFGMVRWSHQKQR